jgi:hypothetical protein
LLALAVSRATIETYNPVKTLLKRQILTASLLVAAATCIVSAACPLGTTSTSNSQSIQSPENGGKKELVLHNGHQICISVHAVPAHLKNGDKDLGPCTGGGKK